MDFKKQCISIAVFPDGDSLYSEYSSTVSVKDEGAGCFAVVHQEDRGHSNAISITANEWPILRSAIEEILAICAEIDKEQGA